MDKIRIFFMVTILLATCIPITFCGQPSPADRIVNSLAQNPDRTAIAAIESLHFNDVWAYYIDTGVWEEIHPSGITPEAMRNHSAVYDPINQRMIISGGMNDWYSYVVGTIWSLSLIPGSETWSVDGPTTGYFPGDFSNDDMLYSPSLKSIVGYRSDLSTPVLYLWNMETNVAQQINFPNYPSRRTYAAVALDEKRNRLILYGGGDGATVVYDELWSLDLTPGAEQWTQLPRLGDAPPVKWLLRAVVDSVRDKFILYGGNSFPNWTDGDYKDTTYELDLTSDTWTLVPTITPPSARGQYGVIWDPLMRREFIFGGLYRVGAAAENIITYNEIWTYDNDSQSWFQQLPSGPKPQIRRRPTAVFDEANRRMIIFGGQLIRPLVQVQTVVSVPLNGRRIDGDCVTVMAEIVTGSAEKVRDVRFQYRLPSITGVWTDIIPAGCNHPNPDADSPFYVHWDVTGLSDGDVDLRAFATGIDGMADTAPDDITVMIDHVNPETDESLTTDSHVQITYEIDESVMNDIAVSDEYLGSNPNAVNANMRIRIPEGTLTTGTLVTASFANLVDHPELDPTG
ncbi:MAG: hypothetical protein NT106_14635, partial [Candidatus Sumerlaeota bacterium]|nr:hypothetical protein [Candidatus Sumerlaeota bacterium]